MSDEQRILSIIEDYDLVAKGMKLLFAGRFREKGLGALAVNVFDYQGRDVEKAQEILRKMQEMRGRHVVVSDGLKGEWVNFYEGMSGVENYHFVLNSGNADQLVLARKKGVMAFDKFRDYDIFVEHVLQELSR